MYALICAILCGLPHDCPPPPPCPRPPQRWLVQYAGVTVKEVATLAEAERFAWHRIRHHCQERWLFEIRRAD